MTGWRHERSTVQTVTQHAQDSTHLSGRRLGRRNHCRASWMRHHVCTRWQTSRRNVIREQNRTQVNNYVAHDDSRLSGNIRTSNNHDGERFGRNTGSAKYTCSTCQRHYTSGRVGTFSPICHVRVRRKIVPCSSPANSPPGNARRYIRAPDTQSTPGCTRRTASRHNKRAAPATCTRSNHCGKFDQS